MRRFRRQKEVQDLFRQHPEVFLCWLRPRRWLVATRKGKRREEEEEDQEEQDRRLRLAQDCKGTLLPYIWCSHARE